MLSALSVAELCRTDAARLAASSRLRASRRWRSELSRERSLARGGWPFRGFFGTGGGILLSWTGMIKSRNERVCAGTRGTTITTTTKICKGVREGGHGARSMRVKARFHGGSHLCGVREHGGGLLHEVSLTIGGGEAPTVHGR